MSDEKYMLNIIDTQREGLGRGTGAGMRDEERRKPEVL